MPANASASDLGKKNLDYAKAATYAYAVLKSCRPNTPEEETIIDDQIEEVTGFTLKDLSRGIKEVAEQNRPVRLCDNSDVDLS